VQELYTFPSTVLSDPKDRKRKKEKKGGEDVSVIVILADLLQ
jgi:hypothetical protein